MRDIHFRTTRKRKYWKVCFSLQPPDNCFPAETVTNCHLPDIHERTRVNEINIGKDESSERREFSVQIEIQCQVTSEVPKSRWFGGTTSQIPENSDGVDQIRATRIELSESRRDQRLCWSGMCIGLTLFALYYSGDIHDACYDKTKTRFLLDEFKEYQQRIIFVVN